jgi:hypothetical protein
MPVREYFFGHEVSVNTVLAAYLRAQGLPVSGQPWEAAKQAMDRGATFKEAVLSAATRPTTGVEPAPVSANQVPAPFEGRVLSWFPKQFGPGDIDGVGAKRLLGAPKIDPAWVLVRETGQNTWDARGTAHSIDFILNLRLINGPVLETLRKCVFTDDPPKTGLAELLQRDELWALEISDRGTVGLGGPIRNDLAVDPGVDTDFIDLVFNIGAPRDVYLGGGTYGFGKTIAYVASSVGTVLFWSRCEGSRGLEYRLIGSAIGDGFNRDGRRFTGRHWWGNAIAQENRVEPAVGNLAKELGEAVFETHFDITGTGTSILILDPQLGGASPEENVGLLADAVVWNLWPKLLAEQTGRSRMNIRVQLNGTPIALPSVERHPVLSGHAQCLLAVRAVQAGSDLRNSHFRYPVQIEEIWCERPLTLLGHLALARYPVPAGAERPSHSVTLMRHQAELVVRYFERQELSVEGFQWAGVFKPVPEVDDSFALSEPPAHDDWVPQAVLEKSRRREVNVALRRIREAADEFLSPRSGPTSAQDVFTSAAHVGDMLADLLGGLEGSAPSTRTVPYGPIGSIPTGSTEALISGPFGTTAPGLTGTSPPPTGTAAAEPTATVPVGPAGTLSAGPTGSAPPGSTGTLTSGGRGRRGTRPHVDVVGASHAATTDDGWTRTTIDVQLANGATGAAVVDVSVRVGVDGGSWEDSDVIRIIGWAGESSGVYDPRPQQIPPGMIRHFVYEARSDLAVDVETKVSEG